MEAGDFKSQSLLGLFSYYTRTVSNVLDWAQVRQQLLPVVEFFEDRDKCKQFIDCLLVDLCTQDQ
jgi:hypothetical protein